MCHFIFVFKHYEKEHVMRLSRLLYILPKGEFFVERRGKVKQGGTVLNSNSKDPCLIITSVVIVEQGFFW